MLVCFFIESSGRQIRRVNSLKAFLPAAVILLLPMLVFAEKLPFKTYTTSEGLAHDRVNRIVKDSRGFLWFARAKVCRALTAMNLRIIRRTTVCRTARLWIYSKHAREIIGWRRATDRYNSGKLGVGTN